MALGIVLSFSPLLAENVVPMALSIRPNPVTVTLLNPQGQSAGGMGTDTVIRPGDILTFVIQSTSTPNNAARGVNSYLTAYIPDNTEVVGARFIDANGNTLLPALSGLAYDGVSGFGARAYVSPLVNGSLAQLYADSGIFFSTDPRTERRPIPSPSEPFISVVNGLSISPAPTGGGQLDNFYGFTGPPFHAHNEWDLTQVLAFGVAGTVTSGRGNTPEHIGSSGFGYGSPVAGPQSWYKLEATIDPSGSPITTENAKFLGNVGPWQRIRTIGAEIGRRSAGPSPPAAGQVMPNPGLLSRVGVPAVDGSGNLLGWALSADNPLPSTSPRTYAVRFATGELAVGSVYFAELSLRVKQLPLESQSVKDAVCVEIFAGDASGISSTDNPWRYFLPSPACVGVNLLLTNSVNKVQAVSGDTLTYTITAKNLSTQVQQDVVVRTDFQPAEVAFVSATPPGTVVAGSVVWPPGTLSPGSSVNFTANFTVSSTSSLFTNNFARYTSESLPSPGVTATAHTALSPATRIRLVLVASPSYIPTLPASVHYTSRVENQGSGTASTSCVSCYVEAALPAGFSYQAGSSRINGASAADPSVTGQKLRYPAAQLPTSIAAGAMLTIEFDATVAAGTAAGLYTADLQSWLRDPGLGRDIEDSITSQAPVAVISPRSDTPVLSTPIAHGRTSVAGATTEPAESTVRAFVNGNPAGTGVSSASGTFSVSVPNLFPGQRVTATVQANGELESLVSLPAEVDEGPFAVNDSYSVSEDTELVVAAPGVLSNDSDADGDTFTAALVSSPAHGTFTLNADGSFTYTPGSGYDGPDAFTYKANDGVADSNVATVSITVTPKPATLSINDVSLTEGASGTTDAMFTVTLSAPSLQTVTVSYATADDSATAGSDYVSKSDTLTFAPSVVSQEIRISINGDITTEPAETFFVNLSSGSVTIADPEGLGTILNDDFDPNNDGALTVEDIIVLLNYLFGNGPLPAGPAEADGIDGLSVGDVFAAINRLFL